MNINNTYVAFDDNGENLFISIAEILSTGCPVNVEGEEEDTEMDISSFDLYQKNDKGEFVKI